jgi:hypothetical protein
MVTNINILSSGKYSSGMFRIFFENPDLIIHADGECKRKFVYERIEPSSFHIVCFHRNAMEDITIYSEDLLPECPFCLAKINQYVYKQLGPEERYSWKMFSLNKICM